MSALVLAILLSALAPGRIAEAGETGRHVTEVARVIAVHDGDTITISESGHQDKVRLVGIDAPELDDERAEYREAADAARDFARSKLKGERVTLEADTHQANRDKYSRLLRYVILRDGTNFNEELVRKGYARVYGRFQFGLKDEFKQAEAEAKRGHLGIWRLPPGPARQVPPASH